MTLNLRIRMERRLRKLGIAKSAASLYSGFFFSLMMSVCGLFGLLDGSPEVLYGLGNGSGKLIADPRAVSVLSASFGLRRH